jgi:hypothetical protein
MKHVCLLLGLVASILTGCVSPAYYGKPIVTSEGEKVCGLHGTAVKPVKGFIVEGCVLGSEDYGFAARRAPNTLFPGFWETYDAKWAPSHPRPTPVKNATPSTSDSTGSPCGTSAWLDGPPKPDATEISNERQRKPDAPEIATMLFCETEMAVYRSCNEPA